MLGNVAAGRLGAALGQKPVRVILRGGLGNQLFGWATGFSLAKRLDVGLVLDGDQIRRKDTSVLDPRAFELNHFGLRKARERWRPKFLPTRTGPVFREAGFRFDPRIDELTTPVSLDGYFQSWRYFYRHEAHIREVLGARTISPGPVSELLDGFRDLRWIGVHVRRGDYLRVNTMALPGQSYYREAIELVAGQVRAQRIIVFTDDVNQAKQIVPGANLYVGPRELPEAANVLTALSYCDGLVGANSSLSWWASYINKNSEAPRIFPATWFTDSTIDTADLLPSRWRTLPSNH